MLGTGYAEKQKTCIDCGKLIDAVSNSVLAAKTIIGEGDKIAEMKDNYATSDAAD